MPISQDPRSGERRRRHRHESVRQRAVNEAARTIGLTRLATGHMRRHSGATSLLEDGDEICPIQELLGHGGVKTTMIHTHVLNRGGPGVDSPLDRCCAGRGIALGGGETARGRRLTGVVHRLQARGMSARMRAILRDEE